MIILPINYHLLKMKYEDVRFIFLGDFNDHKPDLTLLLTPRLRQTVHYPTCGTHTLDLLTLCALGGGPKDPQLSKSLNALNRVFKSG